MRKFYNGNNNTFFYSSIFCASFIERPAKNTTKVVLTSAGQTNTFVASYYSFKKINMKKLILSVVFGALVSAAFIIGCKKKDSSSPSYSCSTCITAPEAKAANDTVSKGVYKGVIIGSSGTIKFDIMNSDSTIKAYMVVDGTSVTLTASVRWSAGVSYVSDFKGTMNGQDVTISFKVDANGGNPTVTSMNIPGHPNATLTLSKETSTNLIKCFEGSYKDNTTGETGTFDLFLSTGLKKWMAQTRKSGGTSSGEVDGTFDGTTLSFDDGKGTTGSATLSGDNIINGTWKNTKPENGTWEAKRTL
jgi:uncharacterized protein with FMN-binding domain